MYSFYARRSQKRQMTLLTWRSFFAHSGSTCMKAVCRTLMKLSPGVNFTNRLVQSKNMLPNVIHQQNCPKLYQNTQLEIAPNFCVICSMLFLHQGFATLMYIFRSSSECVPYFSKLFLQYFLEQRKLSSVLVKNRSKRENIQSKFPFCTFKLCLQNYIYVTIMSH